MSCRISFVWLIALCPICGLSQVLASSGEKQDFTDLGIEELLKVEVSDVFKTPLPKNQVPAAIYVVTQDQISRSGARTIPEALRLVPGVEVSRIGSVYYAVTIRGFGANPSNKILVLLDGRSLYSPYQDGVYWEVEDVVMSNIERIEVVRGPGGSLWGANAVNGVINIVTKNTKETLGGLVQQSVGDLQKNRSFFQFGGSFGASTTVRIYGKYGIDHSADLNPDGTVSARDGSDFRQAGFRADIDLPRKNSLMLQGEIANYNISEDQFVALPSPPYNETTYPVDLIKTSHLLGKWEDRSTDGGLTSVQAYYDLLSYPYTNQGSSASTYDLNLEHRFPEIHHQSISCGFGYRYMLNAGFPGPSTIFDPESRIDQISSVFAQDQLNIGSTEHLTAGLKLEHNSYTGYEIEPNLRFSYTPTSEDTLWASIGRSVRTPSQSEANIFTLNSVSPPVGTGALPIATATLGNTRLSSESLVANEVGFRTKSRSGISFDGSAFYNIYTNLIYQAPGASFNSSIFGPPLEIQPSYYRNGDQGTTYGIEATSRYSIHPDLKLELGLTALLHSHFREGTNMDSPPYQATLHIAWDPNQRLKLDASLHWYDAIFEQGVNSYTKLDLHAGWDVSKKLSLSIGGNDLFVPHHNEYGSGYYIPRSFVAEAKYRF